MKKMVGFTETFTAKVGITRAKTGGSGELTVLLEEVRYIGKLLTDHSWTTKPENFPRKGKRIEFTATIYKYLSVDNDGKQIMKYGLTKPSRIKEV